MTKTLGLLSVAVLFGLGTTTFAAGVSGSVSFEGKAKKRRAVKMKADPGCVKANAGKKVLKDNIVINGGKLANVFVYLKGVKGKFKTPSTPVTLDQKGCMYAPHVIGVMVKQPIKILNSDPLLHNVHSMAKKNKKSNFNAGMAVKGQVLTKSFKKEEVMIKVKCDVHGWMSSYIGVLSHPFYAVTDSKGSFSIANVPDGDYTLVAWHEKYKTQEQKISVKGGVASANFTYKK